MQYANDKSGNRRYTRLLPALCCSLLLAVLFLRAATLSGQTEEPQVETPPIDVPPGDDSLNNAPSNNVQARGEVASEDRVASFAKKRNERSNQRLEVYRNRIWQAGFIGGALTQAQIPTIFTQKRIFIMAVAGLLGLQVRSQSDYQYGLTWAEFGLGPNFGYSEVAAFNMVRLATQQLFRLGPHLRPPEGARLANRYSRALRFYLGFSAQMEGYSGYLGMRSTFPPQPTGFLELRANLSLALIHNASGQNTLQMLSKESDSRAAPYRRGLEKRLYRSWGLIFNVFSVGLGDQSDQNLLENPQFLLSDWFSIEFFYSRLTLLPDRQRSHSFSYHVRLTYRMIPVEDLLFLYRNVEIHLEFFVSYAWKWN